MGDPKDIGPGARFLYLFVCFPCLLAVLALLWLAQRLVGSCVDQVLARDHAPSVGCWQPFGYVDERLNDAAEQGVLLATAPSSCKDIHSLDIASSSAMAAQCWAWCEQSLGKGAGSSLLLATFGNQAPSVTVFQTCPKAQISTVARMLFPEWWHAYLCASIYRLAGIAFLAYNARPADARPESEPSESLPRTDKFDDDGPFLEGNLGFPWNTLGIRWFFSIQSDSKASRFKLIIKLISILTEPFFDIVSIVTFARNGQPMYLLVCLMGLVVSSFGGLLQTGALAGWYRSWQRGCDHEELVEALSLERPDAISSTLVQLYALISIPAAASPWAVLQLAVFAGMSLALTLPDGTAMMIARPWVKDFYAYSRKQMSVSILEKLFASAAIIIVVEFVAMNFSNKWRLHLPFWALLTTGAGVLLIGMVCRLCKGREPLFGSKIRFQLQSGGPLYERTGPDNLSHVLDTLVAAPWVIMSVANVISLVWAWSDAGSKIRALSSSLELGMGTEEIVRFFAALIQLAFHIVALVLSASYLLSGTWLRPQKDWMLQGEEESHVSVLPDEGHSRLLADGDDGERDEDPRDVNPLSSCFAYCYSYKQLALRASAWLSQSTPSLAGSTEVRS